MTVIHQKFKALNEEIEHHPSLSPSSKIHLKQLLAAEQRKVEQIYHVLKGARSDALACPFFNETIQHYLLSSEQTFRSQMQRCINDNQQKTQQSISHLTTLLNTSVVGPHIRRPDFQVPPTPTVREAVGKIITQYNGLFSTPRDTSNDKSSIDRLVGRAVQDTCALVQTATLLPKIVVVGIVTAGCNASDTIRDMMHHAGETITALPISQAYVSARDAFTERVEQNHGVSRAWTQATVDDLAAMATCRLPRYVSNRPFSRSFSLPPSIERGMAFNTEGAASAAAASASSLFTHFAKRHLPRSQSCHPSSNGGNTGGGHAPFSTKTTTKTTQVSEQLAPGYTQVTKDRVKITEKYEQDRLIKTTVHDSTSGVQVSKDARPLEVEFTRSAAKELSKLEGIQQQRIGKAIDALKTHPFPHGYRHMCATAGESTRYYRIRVGKDRVIYAIDEKLLIKNVIPKKNNYREF